MIGGGDDAVLQIARGQSQHKIIAIGEGPAKARSIADGESGVGGVVDLDGAGVDGNVERDDRRRIPRIVIGHGVGVAVRRGGGILVAEGAIGGVADGGKREASPRREAAPPVRERVAEKCWAVGERAVVDELPRSSEIGCERNDRLRRPRARHPQNQQTKQPTPHGAILSAPISEGRELHLPRLPVFWLTAPTLPPSPG